MATYMHCSSISQAHLILDYMNSFLMDRFFSVKVNGYHTGWTKTNYGVPQGSPISAILFLCYIDGITALEMATNIKVQYYADDTVLTSQYDANNTHNKAAHDFQLAISYVEWYCRLHHLQINPTKTVYMIFSNKVDRNKYALPLVICDAKLDPTKHDQTRYLGVILRYDLRWNAHIQHTLSRCWNVYHSITKSIKFMWRTNAANIPMILEA
eukprot:345162_1